MQGIHHWLKGLHDGKAGFLPSGAAGTVPVGAPVREVSASALSWIDRLDRWFWRQEQASRERYLAASTDLVDLEQRMRTLERAGLGGFL